MQSGFVFLLSQTAPSLPHQQPTTCRAESYFSNTVYRYGVDTQTTFFPAKKTPYITARRGAVCVSKKLYTCLCNYNNSTINNLIA